MMRIISVAMNQQDWFSRIQREEFGYETKTTFWQDFTIADAWGAKGIKDTFNRAFSEWKNNIVYCTELILVLNHKSWFYATEGQVNESLSTLYADLFYKAQDYAYRHFKGEDAEYLFSVLD